MRRGWRRLTANSDGETAQRDDGNKCLTAEPVYIFFIDAGDVFPLLTCQSQKNATTDERFVRYEDVLHLWLDQSTFRLQNYVAEDEKCGV